MKQLFLIILFSISLSASSQSVDSLQFVVDNRDCEILLSKNYLKSYWSSGLTILEQPLHYDWKDWTVFGGVAAATTLSFIYDEEIYFWVNENFSQKQAASFSQYSDVFGEEVFIVPTIAMTYAVSAINKDCRLRNLSLAALQSFIFAEAASAGIKVLSCRTRPTFPNIVASTGSATEDNSRSQIPTSVPNSHQWLGPFATFESTSFASGHSMRAFALATTVAGFYPEKTWVGIVSYSLATLTSAGRVVSSEHWTSDVIVGAALGYFIGRGVVKFNEKIGNISGVDIQPIATNYGLGIVINF